MRLLIFLLAGAVVLVCLSCGRRRFPGYEEVRQQLSESQRAYEDTAEDWARGPGKLTFCYFGDGEYRWSDYYIDRSNHGFQVGRGSKNQEEVSSLGEAARKAGTTPETLDEWVRRAERLNLYCIDQWAPSGYVQILLRGSEWQPYGLRYAPKGNEHAYNALVEYAKQGREENTDVVLRPIASRWFYFESRRF